MHSEDEKSLQVPNEKSIQNIMARYTDLFLKEGKEKDKTWRVFHVVGICLSRVLRHVVW
jgi:hypothetical protein